MSSTAHPTHPRRVAVIGGGWAGMAAALAHAQAGRRVTVFESARTLGGRARAVAGTLADGTPVRLDNGQHILIGAYTESLRLMRQVGIDPETALLRLPLTLQYPDGGGLRLPDLAPPLDALWGIARAHGWLWRDRIALLRTASRWQLRGFRCAPTTSVAQLCAGLTPRLLAEFIDPLCVSALNTRAHDASGQVFLRVLQDSLFSGRGGSNLLLPRTDLGTLFPVSAAQWLAQHGGVVRTGERVQRLHPLGQGRWQVQGAVQGAPSHPPAHHPADVFDHVTLATSSWEAARLVQDLANTADNAGAGPAPGGERSAARDWARSAQALHYEAITTVYAHAPGASLRQPMLSLRNTAEHPAQFVFDRGPLDGQHGLLAFVISASEGDRATLEQQVLHQAQAQLGLGTLQPVQTVVEKRATFACTPALVRPAAQVMPGLVACGDYVQGPYPATLEGAVRSAQEAAALCTA